MSSIFYTLGALVMAYAVAETIRDVFTQSKARRANKTILGGCPGEVSVTGGTSHRQTKTEPGSPE